MAAMSRREFMEKAAVGSGVAGFLVANAAEAQANPLGLPIGSQVYPVRSMLKDFPAFAKQMAEIGVTRLELCSPIGYGKDFASLANGSEVRKILADHGMKAESSHFSMAELRKSQEKSIEWAKEVGITQMITATLGGGNNPTLDQVKRAADEYNKIAAVAAQAGMEQGLHNEGFEALDGRRQTDLRPVARPARSVACQVPVPDVHNHGRLRRRRLLPQVPWPVLLDASARHRHECAGSCSVAQERCDGRGEAGGAAHRLRWARAASIG